MTVPPKPKRARKPKAEATAPEAEALAPLHELDARYELVEVDRRDIAFAAYNPRGITDIARAKLRKALQKVGLLAPVTWNRTTGRLVGGHQRIKALDAINGGQRYRLRVAAVEMSEAEEVAANTLLNNPEAQGEMDLELFAEVLKREDFDAEAAGLDAADIFRVIGDQAADAVLEEVANRVQELRAGDERSVGTVDNAPHWYLVIVFKDNDERMAFTNALGIPDNRYQSAEQLKRALAEAREARSDEPEAGDVEEP